MIGRIFVLCILLSCVTYISNGQVGTGKVLSFQKTAGGIKGTTTQGIFEITATNEHTIRIRFSPRVKFKPLPYALANTNYSSVNVEVKQEKGLITFSTIAIKLQVYTEPSLRLVFTNENGVLVNEDMPGEGFGISLIGDRWTVYKRKQENERFVGMGEALGNLDRTGTGIALNNTDTYKYGDHRLSMYSSIPFYMAFHNKMHYGIFYNNSYPAFFNFALSTPNLVSATFQGGDVDYFFIHDNSPAKILEHYTWLTGRMPLPPMWSLGYHQSRCSYFNQEQVEWVGNSFRSKKIPLDCIVLDADYQYRYQPFRGNEQRFPNIKAMADKLEANHIQLTASVYPGVAIDSSYHSFRDGIAADVFLRYTNGDLFNTEIAPVKCYLPDYTKADARAWWRKKMRWLPENGIHGYWNDMNEPAIGGSHLPDNVVFNFDGITTNALEGKNVYGFQMARASYEAAMENSQDRRPFVLSRSGFAGVQRFAALWSGDNTASGEGLLSSVLLNNQLGLSGIAFCGHDIGGFIGDGTKELYQRWMQAGVFSPFCRNHKGCGATAGEPWAYGPETEAIAKAYISFRYQLLPYIYSAFYQAAQSGMPVARSLCLSQPFDNKVYDVRYQQQFIFGESIMVIPVTPNINTSAWYLPAGKWYNLYTDAIQDGNTEGSQSVLDHQIPLFVKAGAIIPKQATVQYAGQKNADTLELHVYNGDEASEFKYYEDAGDGWEFQKGGYHKRLMQFQPSQRAFIISGQEGSYSSSFKKVKLVMHGFNQMSQVKVNGVIHALGSSASHRFFDPLQELETIYDPDYLSSLRQAEKVQPQQTVLVDFIKDAINIAW